MSRGVYFLSDLSLALGSTAFTIQHDQGGKYRYPTKTIHSNNINIEIDVLIQSISNAIKPIVAHQSESSLPLTSENSLPPSVFKASSILFFKFCYVKVYS